MPWKIHLFRLSITLVQLLRVAASTNTDDFVALKSLKDIWENIPPNWVGDDPCGNEWVGISCSNDRVVSITLASINLRGQLSSDITLLSELQTLDLSYNNMTGPLPPTTGELKNLSSLIVVGCGFSGEIPPSIGSLTKLVYLSLNRNNFIGQIPPSLGHLSSLRWLDIADNKLTGSIPVSRGSTPGLDMLVETKHFHFGNNELSGEIPSQLFSSNMKLIHLLLENNKLTGSIPSSLGLMHSLEVVRLDRNSLSGTVPENLNNLSSVQELYLANNRLTGAFPNMTGMSSLNYVDFSNNSFNVTDVPPWLSSLQSLTSLILENTRMQGQLPVSLFSLPQLQAVVLKGNRVEGTLNIGPNYSDKLQLIDLQNNLIDEFTQREHYNVGKIILAGNPICDEGVRDNYCNFSQQNNSSYSTPPQNCALLPCDSAKIASPRCKCSYPYSGDLIFRAPSFYNFGNESLFGSLEQKLMASFESSGQPVDSVSVSNPTKNSNSYLVLNLQVFPSGKDYFNREGIIGIGFMLSNQTFKPPREFGPFYFHANNYQYLEGLTEGSRNSSSTTVIIGATVGGSVLVLLLIVAGVYAFRQKRLAKSASKRADPFASWDSNSNSGGVPQLKGARCFSFEEIKRCTNNFSTTNDLGSGGYGKVYRGTLPNGQLVAVKKSAARVHTRGTDADIRVCHQWHVEGQSYRKTGIRLDWMRRLRVALGAARGVQYLHELANPPIIHRDIKSNNILLDERLNAKVADFGLSKPMSEPDKSHVTTQVKGTMGYLDPEYYITQQLTEKSDVYSFGVLLLEILTSRTPIVKGKYVVREVKEAMDRTKKLYNLEAMLDPIVASNMAPGTVERFVDLGLWCVQDLGVNRPAMGEVVKEIENIMEMAGINPNAESTSTSDNYEGGSKGSGNLYSNESIFTNSGGYSSSNKMEPK